MRRSPWIAIAALTLALATGAPFDVAKGQEPVRIGIYLPMTGAYGVYGRMQWEGVRIAHSMQPEVLGRKVELIPVADTRSDELRAAREVKRLVEDEQAAAIIGEALSSHTLSGNAVCEEAGTPSVTPSAGAPQVTRDKAHAFRACFADPFQGGAAARFARQRLEAERAVVVLNIDAVRYRPGVDPADDYRMGLGEEFEKTFEALGGRIVSKIYVRTDDPDFRERFSEQLPFLKESPPQAIYVPDYYRQVGILARALRDSGIEAPILAGDGAYSRELPAMVGEAPGDLYLTVHFHPDLVATERGREYASRFRQSFKEKPVDAFGALGADAYFLLTDAMERAGSSDREAVKEALASTRDWKGVTGVFASMSHGDPLKSVAVLKMKEGGFSPVLLLEPS